LSWCRRNRISACNAVRDRNSAKTVDQINLQRSLMLRAEPLLRHTLAPFKLILSQSLVQETQVRSLRQDSNQSASGKPGAVHDARTSCRKWPIGACLLNFTRIALLAESKTSSRLS